jgi:hypothetical protein
VSISDDVKHQLFSVICPRCEKAHHGVEVTFPAVNDFGHWIVECEKCGDDFIVEVKNPRESGGAMKSQIKSALEEPFVGDRQLVAVEKAKHSFDLNRNKWPFNYAGIPLYECEKSGANLDVLAQEEVKKAFKDIGSAYLNAQNSLVKGGPDHDVAVVRIDISCLCGIRHQATFYTKMIMNPGHGLEDEEKLVLANITGSNLSETLTGLVSKSEFMDLLEKLVARWNLLTEQIVVVSPFVGYPRMGEPKKLDIWKRVLSILDADRAAFLTRPTTWSEYKMAMENEGVPVKLLERFDLQNSVVARRNSKQDFHAKFYAGVSADKCELLSGSANLVGGPSVENIAFHGISRDRFNKRYLDKLNLKKPLPAPRNRTRHWVLIEKTAVGWLSFPTTAPSYIEVT